MPILLVPPTEMISENQEIPKSVLAEAQSYQKNFLAQLNLSTPLNNITTGAYKGTSVYNWDKKFNGILLTSFIFPKGKSFPKEWARTATLLKQEDCSHLGSLWSFSNKNTFPFPMENSNLKITTIAERVFQALSPVKLDLDSNLSDKGETNIFNVVLQESFSNKNLPIISNTGRFFCKIEVLKDPPLEQQKEYPARPHRLVQVSLRQKQRVSNSLQVNMTTHLNSGVFGQKKNEFEEKLENSEFNPEKIARNLVEKILPLLDDLSKSEFKIVKRMGSWVYLNRGRAFGLTIGMRLTGPNNSKLHIIRYAPNLDGEIDSAIAFIRHENQESPLLKDDILKLDPKTYPK